MFSLSSLIILWKKSHQILWKKHTKCCERNTPNVFPDSRLHCSPMPQSLFHKFLAMFANNIIYRRCSRFSSSTGKEKCLWRIMHRSAPKSFYCVRWQRRLWCSLPSCPFPNIGINWQWNPCVSIIDSFPRATGCSGRVRQSLRQTQQYPTKQKGNHWGLKRSSWEHKEAAILCLG